MYFAMSGSLRFSLVVVQEPVVLCALRVFSPSDYYDAMLESIGHYQIRRKIGQGGMGVVYEGWDDRLKRSVAIKAILEGTESKDARGRLWREARSLARVNHPHVCQVFDVLEEGEALVLILELLNGQSLAERLLTGMISTAEALDIEREILGALQALHDLGIVHRDLKPSNVFLTRHGIKLLDFGLARTTDTTFLGDPDQTRTAASLTAPGLLVGTPQYMAPEQAGGLPVGPPADIFAAGTILYEMLTGRRPFDGTSLVDVLYAVLHQNPPPLSGSREIEALDRVIRRAMAKRVEDRYSSAREMLGAMESILLSGSTAVASRTRTVSRIIVLPFRALKSDEQTDFLAWSLPEAISNSLSGMENLLVRSCLMAARLESPPDPRRVAVEADVDAFLTGSLVRAGDRFRLTCQLIEAPGGSVFWSDSADSSMQDLFVLQDELCEHILQSLKLPLDEREQRSLRRDVPATARAYECYLRANQIAVTRTLDNMGLARDLYLQCLEESPGYAPAWACLGRVYHFLEKFDEDSGENLKRTEEAFNRAFALNPDLPVAHNFYTSVECDQGHAQKAMSRLLKRARFRRNDPELFAGLVQACRYCDELEASVAAHHRGRHLDPHLVTSAAHTYFLLGDYGRAIDCYGRKVGYYLDCAALAAQGEDRAALALLRERTESSSATGTIQGIMRSLRAYLEGDWKECLKVLEAGEAVILKDPETSFYTARQLARINQTDRAISALSNAIDMGYLCANAISRDPWFASLRPSPRYTELMRKAELRRSESHVAFLAAGGDQVISVM
jgi:serine/threonine protein kinase/tetratricopeptide (TPR) repeat protein